jgi:hypothetical protein
MAVTVKIGGSMATIQDYHWTSDDETLAALLNARLDPRGPSGADPDPDYNAAMDAITRYSGEIVHADRAESPEGLIY